MQKRYLEVDLMIIHPESGGRLKPIHVRPNGSQFYAPHLVVSHDWENNEMLGVKFLDGPEVLHAGERGQVVMQCMYFDPSNKPNAPNYDKFMCGTPNPNRRRLLHCSCW